MHAQEQPACHCATDSEEELFGRKLLRAVLHTSNPTASPLYIRHTPLEEDTNTAGLS